jgi:hypothetical protein
MRLWRRRSTRAATGPRPLNLLAVWVAGIGWRGGEYEVVVVDEQGHAMVGPTVFGGRRVGELVRVLLDYAARRSHASSRTSGSVSWRRPEVDANERTLEGLRRQLEAASPI